MLTLLAAVTALGILAAAAQVLFARELLVVFHGNEIALGLIFAGWFAGIFLGAAGGGAASRRFGSENRGRTLFAVVLLIPPVLLPAQWMLVRAWRLIVRASPGAPLPPGSAAAGAFVAVLPTAAVVGFGFAAAVAAARATRDPGAVGRVYVAEAIGAAAGGLAATFLLVPRMSPAGVVAVLCATGFAASIAAATGRGADRAHRMRRARRVIGAAGGLGLAAVLIAWTAGGVGRAGAIADRLRWTGFLGADLARDLVVSTDTAYGNVSLFQRAGQAMVYADGRFVGSFPDERANAAVVHTLLCLHPDPRRVLLLGTLPTLVRPALAHPVESIDWVDLDPGFHEVLRAHLPEADRHALDDARVRIGHDDAAAFLRRGGSRYDVIFLQAGRPDTVAVNRFFTEEFYRRIHERLAPGGVFAFVQPSSEHLRGDEAALAACLRATLRTCFDEVAVGGGDPRWFVAGRAPATVTLDGPTLADRFTARGIDTGVFHPYHFLGAETFDPDRIAFVRDRLDEADPGFVNRDLHPAASRFVLRQWLRIAAPGSAALLGAASTVPAWLWAAATGAGILALAGIRRPGRRAGRPPWAPALVAIATTGFAALALQLVVLLLFQDLLGAVYERIGLFSAVFMVGLVGGGGIAHRILARSSRARTRAVVAIELAAAAWAVLVAVVAVALVNAPPGSVAARPAVAATALAALALGTGMITGAEFPLVNRWMRDRAARPIAAAAWTDAADHLGAAAAAALVGVLWMPVYGLAVAALLVAAIKLPSAVWIAGEP